MPNTLITSDIILNEMLVELKNVMVLCELVDKQYSNQFGSGQTLKRGDSVKVRRRVNFASTNVFANDGDMTGNLSDIDETSAAIRLEHQDSVMFEISSQDATLSISDFRERFIRPAAIELAQKCETAIAREFQKAPWLVTGGITGFQDIANLDSILDDYGVPMMDRHCCLTPQMMVDLATVLTTVFPTKIATRAIEKALVTELGNFPIYKFQSAVNHVVGLNATGITVNGAAQETTWAVVGNNDYISQDLVVAAIADTINAGDTFTLADVYQVNHRTRESTGRLQQFVVLEDAAAAATTLSISPAIITTGPYQTVFIAGDTLPDATVGTSTSGVPGSSYFEGMAFHKQALTYASADLEPFKGGVDNSTGALDSYTMRVAMDSDIIRDKTICRLDTLYGIKLLEPRSVVRIAQV